MATFADIIGGLKKKLVGGYNQVADALPLVPNTSQIKSFTSNPVQYLANPSYNAGNNLYGTTPFKVSANIQQNIYKNAQSPDPFKNYFAKMYVNAGEAVRDYFDPVKTPTLTSIQGVQNYGKAVGLTALPVLNMAMAPKVSPQTFLGSMGIGAGFNTVLGDPKDSVARRMRYGAVQGLQSAPLTQLVTGFTNPATDKIVSKIPLKNLAPKAKAIAEGVARGAAAIPEGMTINAVQGQPYTPLDLVLDVTTGSGLSEYAGKKLGDAGMKGYQSFADWFSKNSMTGSQKNFASQGMIGNTRKMNPLDLEKFDFFYDVLRNKSDHPPETVKFAENQINVLAERYLPNKLQSPSGDPMLNSRRIQNRMMKGDLQTFEAGFIKLDEPILGTGKTQGLPKSTVDPLEAQVYQEYVKTDDFKKARNKFWELIGSDGNHPNSTRTNAQANRETSAILKKFESQTKFSPTSMTREEKVARDMLKRGDITSNQYNEIALNNEGKVKPIQGIQNDRSVNTPLFQDKLNSEQSLPQSPLKLEGQLSNQKSSKSGVEKIGEPPVVSPSQGVIDNTKSYINRLYTQAVDRFHPLSQLSKRAGEDQAMRNAITQHYGAGSTATYYVDFKLAPIIKEANVDDLRALTIAKRDLELSGRNIKGSDATSANAVIEGLKQKYGGNISKLEESAGKLYQYQNDLVKTYLVDTGVISKESYEAMRKNNKSYIPFKRVMDQVDTFLGATPQTGNMGSVSSQGVIKKIKGSDRQIIDPLQSVVENTYKIISLGQRNRVASMIASLQGKLPDVIKPFNGEVGNRKDIISVLRNGSKMQYQVPLDVAEAAKGLNEESLNSLIKILAVPSKLVRATATGINPEFMIPNVARDLQSAFVNVGLNPLRFGKGLAHLIKKDSVYQDFLRSGGKTSSVMIDRPFLEKTVNEVSGKPGLEVANPMKLLQTLGEWSEQPTRIAIFEQKKGEYIKKGLSIAEAEVRAANAAQEGTVNFARMGSKMKAANSLVTFLNARLQGADLLLRNAKNNPAGTLFRLGLVSQVPAVLTYLYNRQFNSYNDERVVSKYDKQNNFIIMLSDQPIQSLGGAQFIKIPKGDVGRFANPTENFLSYLDGKGDNKALEDITSAFVGLSPFQNIGDAIPAAIKPPIEFAANRSFFTGQNLVPEYKSSLPPKYQYTSATAPLYKDLGAKLNIAPAKLENTASGYLTGFEKLGSAAYSTLTGQKADNQSGKDINRMPVIRRFLGGEKRTSAEQDIINEKRANSIDFQVNDVKGAVNRGDIPMEDGIKQIQLLRQQQQEIINKRTENDQQSTTNNNIGTQDTSLNKTYYFKDAEGKLKEVNLSTVIALPTLTGQTELDKKLVSKYRSEITKKANDIEALYTAGKITADQAEKQLIELEGMKLKVSKPKVVKIKKAPKIKALRVKAPKMKKSAKIKIGKVKVKIAKIKPLKPPKTIKFKS